MPHLGEVITSRKNPLLKRVREARDEHEQEFLLEGPKFVSDAIATGWEPSLLVLTEDVSHQWQPELRPVIVSPHVFESVSDTRAAQGVLAVFRRQEESPSTIVERASEKLVLILDGVQDPGNVGTILRLAAAFDSGGVILLEGTADAFGPKSVRASTGAILHVPTARMSRSEFLRVVSRRDVDLFAATGSGARALPSFHGLLILGSEGGGIDPSLTEVATEVTIETSGRVESLNVAMAAAVFLSRAFELRRSTTAS